MAYRRTNILLTLLLLLCHSRRLKIIFKSARLTFEKLLSFSKINPTGDGIGQTGMQVTAAIDARPILLLLRGEGTDHHFSPSNVAIFEERNRIKSTKSFFESWNSSSGLGRETVREIRRGG